MNKSNRFLNITAWRRNGRIEPFFCGSVDQAGHYDWRRTVARERVKARDGLSIARMVASNIDCVIACDIDQKWDIVY